MELIHQPGTPLESGEWLRRHLLDDQWTLLRGAVAFVRRPGVNQLRPELDEFVARAAARIVAGVDNRCTSIEGLSDLSDLLGGTTSGLWVFHNESTNSIFHPKMYLFENQDRADLLISSSNLTAGGLATNYEVGVALPLDRQLAADSDLIGEVSALLDAWMDEESPFVKRLDAEILADLARLGYVLPEAFAAIPEAEERPPGESSGSARGLFGLEVFRAPRRREGTEPPADSSSMQEALPWRLDGADETHRGYVMTLQNTDVGVGQTTPGTARRSPEIFVPLSARDDDPAFWGWDDQYVQQPAKPHIWNRDGVHLRLGGETVEATFMVNLDKHDLRIRSESIRSAGAVGDILRLELPAGDADYDYYAEIVPSSSALHATYAALCIVVVQPPSLKKYGYY